jgi:dienelactone hydrolase
LLLLGGSAHKPGRGRWSAAMDWLAPRLSEHGYRTAQVRYPSRHWREMPSAIRATHEALAQLPPARGLIGFSMGGAVAVAASADSDADIVVGLAPWIPEQIDLRALAGRRLRVLHGSLDRPLPGVPGVSPNHSRAAVRRARHLGVDASHRLVGGGVHLIALRAAGRLVPAPRAGRWLSMIVDTLEEGQSA